MPDAQRSSQTGFITISILVIYRDRIAAELSDHVIRRIFGAALILRSAETLAAEAEVRRRVRASAAM